MSGISFGKKSCDRNSTNYVSKIQILQFIVINISIESLVRRNRTCVSRNDVTEDAKSIPSTHPKVLSNPAINDMDSLGYDVTAVDEGLNDRPIIGILAQELSVNLEKWYGDNNTSYIDSSYIKYIEAAGARVVPVLINQPMEYYRTIFTSTNGLLFPGGVAHIELNSGS